MDFRRASRRPQHAFRHSRARHGRDHERHGAARRRHPVRRHVPRLLRLHAPGHPARGAHEAARDLRLHARLDRPRRGRPDAPADRAALGAARHSEPAGAPARRRQRDRGGVARRRRAQDGAGRARAHAPEAALSSTAPTPRPRPTSRTAPTCSATRSTERRPQAIIIATGSEVSIALAAQQTLAADGIATRVVSAPSLEIFAQQIAEVPRYRAPGRRPACRHRGGPSP